MAKPVAALAGAFLSLTLASCGGQESLAAENGAPANETNTGAAAAPSAPPPENAVGNDAAEPVPPPDAVSHPDGYLPPVADSPGANSSAPDPSPPTTEDEHLRNQAGR